LKKSRKVLLLLLGVIVLAGVVFKAMQPKEPEYQGRKLSEWIADLNKQPPKSTEAEIAIRQMKKEALPLIERRLTPAEHKPTKLETFLYHLQMKMGLYEQKTFYGWEDSFKAMEILGDDSLPALERLLEHPHIGGRAAYALARLEAVQALERGAATNKNPYCRWHSVQALSGVSQRKEEATAVLLRLTYDAETGIVAAAVSGLGWLGGNSETVVPRLCEMVENADERIKPEIVFALELLGTNATQAIPSLLKIKGSGDAELRKLAQRALDHIESNQSP
jgi:HEAT repeat protein